METEQKNYPFFKKHNLGYILNVFNVTYSQFFSIHSTIAGKNPCLWKQIKADGPVLNTALVQPCFSFVFLSNQVWREKPLLVQTFQRTLKINRCSLLIREVFILL